MQPISLYVHIPFCLHKCPYCDFNTYAQPSFPEKQYTSALLAELDYRSTLPEWRGRMVQSIYFGGGTPSIFSPHSIFKVVSAILRSFPVDDRVEITLEANPGTLSADAIGGFKEAGVNRLSLGTQSFNPDTLRKLGRVHTAQDTDSALEMARLVGITNVNVDLIFGAPSQTLSDLQADLLEIGRVNPAHVSPYGLTIEKGTPFYNSFKKGSLRLPKEATVIEMMKRITNELLGCGLVRYEISNYAQPGKEARHNLAYWNGADYIGLGAGAHSFSREIGSFGKRWSNYALPQKYIEEASAHGQAESWSELLSPKGAVFEYFFLGLRKIKGVSLAAFKQRFGFDAGQAYTALFQVLQSESLISLADEHVALTERGLLLADSVIENFAEPMLPEALTDKLESVGLESAGSSSSELASNVVASNE